MQGPVCDDNWGLADADVVCRQLGYAQATEATQRSTFGTGPSQFAMDDVACSGDERKIQDCTYNPRDNCGSSELAGVRCTRTSELAKDARYVSVAEAVFPFRLLH